MKTRKILVWVTLVAAAATLLFEAYTLYNRGSPPQIRVKEQLFDGIRYERHVRWSPRPLMIHVITLDMRGHGLRLLVTPADDRTGAFPLRARTTSEFAREYGVQVAINGDGFSPWWSRGLTDYYPHSGDPVAPRGTAASRGKLYWTSQAQLPTLYMSSRNRLSLDAPARPYNAISGETLLVTGGQLMPNLDRLVTQPRTAIGFSKNGRYVYLVVVDGRQPLYSEGMTVQELASLMASMGADYAMSLDGGGSSTMVVQQDDGKLRVVNSPIHNYIPGRERPVANHLGVYAGK